MSGRTRISVVIPNLNSEDLVEGAIDAVSGDDEFLSCEVILSDGGSTDRSRELAAARGARVVTGPRGRGNQLRTGGSAACCPWLLFLHVDTRLGPGWQPAVRDFTARPQNAERAAVFRLRFDDGGRQARRVERLAAWRTRIFGLPYGDQGLLISRRFYDRIGGFQPLPLFEDVELVRRIGKKRIEVLNATAITAADRYRRDGWWLRPIRNLFCLALYFAGVPPRLVERIYR